ncbi:MAG: hypothetical protein HY268_30970 [Deltaproteobacteria bacterium]|nr:hypothetical protein [Deltaproteobacteria bacterium]
MSYTKTAVLAVVGCLALPISTYANGPPQNRQDIEQDFDLAPSANSVEIPGGVHYRRDRKGIRIGGHGTHYPGEGTQQWHIEVDPNKRTYKATPMVPEELPPSGNEQKGVPPFPERPDLEDRSSDRSSFVPAVWRVPSYSLLRKVGWLNPGNWWGSIAIIGIDPPPQKFRVTSTQTQISWWVDNLGNIGMNWYYDAPHAVSPTPVNTHWYIDWTVNLGVWWYQSWITGWEPCHGFKVQYKNIDFPPGLPKRPNNPTLIIHQTQMCGRSDSGYDYWWWHWEYGPYSALLSAYLIVS